MTFQSNLEAVHAAALRDPEFRAREEAQAASMLAETDKLVRSAVEAFKAGYAPWEIIRAEAMTMREAETLVPGDGALMVAGTFFMRLVIHELEQEAARGYDSPW